MRTIVYIDGQNFLYKVTERVLANGLVGSKQDIAKIDIPYLVKQVLPNENPEIRYYGVAKIRRQEEYGVEIREKSEKFADNLRRLKGCLSKTNVKYFPVGILKVRDRDECKVCGVKDYKFQEKGVDVGLAVDIVRDVLENKVDHIVLVSSDTDLMPAIRIAREKKVRITYIAFDSQITQSISRQSDATQIFRDYEIIEAFKRLN